MSAESFVSRRGSGWRSLRRLAVVVPALVFGSIACVIAWSAWPLLRPAREVVVVQAVFDRSAESRSADPSGRSAGVSQTVQAPGWLEAEPFLIACAALTDGTIESIDVLEGEYVERDQVVARLVVDDAELVLRRAEAELAAAEAALAEARAEHTAARRAWDDPIELERAVEVAGAQLAEVEAELAQLPALIRSAEATQLALAEEARRMELSISEGATNELEWIVARQRALAQQAEVDALRGREPMLLAHAEHFRAEQRAAVRDLALRIEDKRRLDATAAAMIRAEATLVAAQTARDEAALALERTVIRAPISGYVQRRLKIPGDKVVRAMDSMHSAHIVHIYDPERIQVRVDIPLADAANVFAGQDCEVVVEVLPDRMFRGEVIRLTHEADLQKNTLQAKVRVIDPDPVLRPEMLTRVKFLGRAGGGNGAATGSGGTGGVVLVPDDAIDDAGRIWLVTDRRNGRGVISARDVTVVEREDGWAAVTGDIQPGALIAVDAGGVREGERVVIRASLGEGAPS